MSKRRTDYIRREDGSIYRADPDQKLGKGESWAKSPTDFETGTLRFRAKVTVNAAAEVARGRFLTPGDGQALVYEAKRTEAVRWLGIVAGGGSPNLAEFPLLAGRATRLGKDPRFVAEEWMSRSDRWMAAAAAIEDMREAAIDAIYAEKDGADLGDRLRAIVDGLEWPER